MDHSSNAFKSVFTYTELINNIDFNVKNVQKLNKKHYNLDAFNIMQMIYPFTLLIKHHCIT